MTFLQTAAAFRRLADGIEAVIHRHGGDCVTGHPKPMLDGAAAAGAAIMLVYLRDLITTAGRDTYDRPALLVLLEIISRDEEMFGGGVAKLMWDANDEDGQP